MTDSRYPIRIELGPWAAPEDHAAPIRLTVFVEEQKVPVEMEWDEFDAVSLHAIAWEGDQAIGTARLLPDGQIGRLAVLKPSRGQGAGAALMRALINQAEAKHLTPLTLHAQCDAERFYHRFGFMAQGPVFIEAGIDHILMVRA